MNTNSTVVNEAQSTVNFDHCGSKRRAPMSVTAGGMRNNTLIGRAK